MKTTTLIVLFAVINVPEAYKIFMYNPKFSASHVNFMGKFADILVRAGHDVIVYEPIVDEGCTTNGTKLAKIVFREKDFGGFTLAGDDIQRSFWTGELEGFLNKRAMWKNFREKFGMNYQINDDQLMDSLKREKFDLGIGEPFDTCYYGVLKRLGINNYITVSSSILYDNDAMALGIPTTPSFVPSLSSSSKVPMTYFEKINNIIQYLFNGKFKDQLLTGDSIEFMKKKFGKAFDMSEQIANSALYLVHVDEHIDFPRPISHKVIYMGSIGKVQAKPLEKKYEDIMKNSKKGVILVSFGTVALSYAMPQEIKQIFLESFKKYPEVTFLWKYEKDEHKIAEGYQNVVTNKWVPQNDLLEHPKLLAFISHGGMNSVQEGASKGVPMIMIPLFADQYRNSKMLEYRKMAVVLDRKQLTVEKLSEALKEIIENDSYRKNAKRLASLIAAKPMSSEERVVKYTEFAAQFGPALNLDMHGRHLNFVQFYCLDIIIPAIVLGVVVFVVSYVLLKTFRLVLIKIFAVVNRESKLKDD